MCVIIAKYFPGTGWAGAKNRDRNYRTEISFEHARRGSLEKMMLHDDVTMYMEGINSHGVSILNTSLAIDSDEPELDAGKTKNSPDGMKISRALDEKSALAAIKSLIKSRLEGNTMVFDQENMYLMEAAYDPQDRFRYVAKRIPHNEVVVRTNHGIWMPWAGFQRVEGDSVQTQDRISSEARLIQARYIAKKARRPQDIVDMMCKVYIDEPRLNILRSICDQKEWHTTAQELCVPRERTLYCRPVNSNLSFDFWQLNQPEHKCWLELLSNRKMWQDNHGHHPFLKCNMKDV